MAAFSAPRRIRRRCGMLLKFTARQAHSCVAQWQSIRLLIGRLLVRVQPQEPPGESPVDQAGDSLLLPHQGSGTIRSAAAADEGAREPEHEMSRT